MDALKLEIKPLDSTRWAIIHQARCDLDKAADERLLLEIAARIYRVIGLPAPAIYRFGSPLAAMLAIPHLVALHGGEYCISGSMDLQTMLKEPLTSRLGTPPDLAWWSEALVSEVVQALSMDVVKQVNPEFLDRFTEQLMEILREKDDGFARDRLGRGLFRPIDPMAFEWWRLVGGSRSWWWPYARFVVVSDRPLERHVDRNGRLHGEDHPAMSFSDGFKIWAWQGIPVPGHVIADPGRITIGEIQAEKNAEVRRVMIFRMGAGKYLKATGAVVLDMDSLTLEGSAPRALFKDADGNVWLVGTDGSTARVYTMPVPRDAASCREAHQAIAGFEESRLIAEA